MEAWEWDVYPILERKWLGNRSLEDKYLDLYGLANNNFGLVKDYGALMNGEWVWNINIAEGELDDQNSEEFAEMKLTLTYIVLDQERSDEMLWLETPDKKISVKSCYILIQMET